MCALFACIFDVGLRDYLHVQGLYNHADFQQDIDCSLSYQTACSCAQDILGSSQVNLAGNFSTCVSCSVASGKADQCLPIHCLSVQPGSKQIESLGAARRVHLRVLAQLGKGHSRLSGTF